MNDKVTQKGAVALTEDALDAAAGGRVSKVDAITIKQKVAEPVSSGDPHAPAGSTIKLN